MVRKLKATKQRMTKDEAVYSALTTFMRKALDMAITPILPGLLEMPWAEVERELLPYTQLETAPTVSDVVEAISSGEVDVALEMIKHLGLGCAYRAFQPGGISLFGGHWEAKHPGRP